MSEFACGAFGGTLGCLTTYPLDTIKTRVQAGVYPGVSDCIRNTLKHEGFVGFYRGFSTPFISQPLYIGGSFGGLEFGRHIFDKYVVDPNSSSNSGVGVAAARHVFGCTVAGLTCATIATPFERTKVLMQAETKAGARPSAAAVVHHAVRFTQQQSSPSADTTAHTVMNFVFAGEESGPSYTDARLRCYAAARNSGVHDLVWSV